MISTHQARTSTAGSHQCCHFTPQHNVLFAGLQLPRIVGIHVDGSERGCTIAHNHHLDAASSFGRQALGLYGMSSPRPSHQAREASSRPAVRAWGGRQSLHAPTSLFSGTPGSWDGGLEQQVFLQEHHWLRLALEPGPVPAPDPYIQGEPCHRTWVGGLTNPLATKGMYGPHSDWSAAKAEHEAPGRPAKGWTLYARSLLTACGVATAIIKASSSSSIS